MNEWKFSSSDEISTKVTVSVPHMQQQNRTIERTESRMIE